MYDPLVVDTFVRVHKEISPEQVTANTAASKGALTEITTSSTSGREPVPSSEHSIEPASQLTLDLAPQLLDPTLSDADVLRGHIITIVECELAILFSYDGGLDQLTVEATSHASEHKLRDLRIGLGERLSGWVAANRRTILNSDPALDLGEFARKVSPVLQNTLSVPLTVGKDLIGVLALYRERSFSEDERALLEHLSKPMAERMATRRRRLSLPDLVASSRKTEAQSVAPVSSLLCVEILNWSVVKGADEAAAEKLVSTLAEKLRQTLATGDLLVRSREDELVALLTRGEAKDVRALARSLRELVREFNCGLPMSLQLEVAVDAMLAPIESAALWDLLTDDSAAATSQPAVRGSVH